MIGIRRKGKWFRGYDYPPGGRWDSVASEMVENFEDLRHPVFKGASALNRGICEKRTTGTPFTTVENLQMWSSCIGFFAH